MTRVSSLVLRRLLEQQSGMVARRQLTSLGVDWDRVRDNVRADRWVVRTPRVISAVTGTLTREQLEWLAVLHAGPRSMLANLDAAARHGLKGWERPYVCVMVDDELSFEPVPGVDFFRSRRPFDLMLTHRSGMPCCKLEPAVLLWAAYEAPVRAAHGILAASVQQRLTTPTSLLTWIDQLHPLRRAKAFRATLGDIAGGSQSGSELDLIRMCRRFGIPLPRRQQPRTDRRGTHRWTDAEWDLPDGRTLILEVDGGHHLDLRQAGEDAKRTRGLVGPTRVVIRCTAYEVRHEQATLARDLLALGVAGRVPDDAA